MGFKFSVKSNNNDICGIFNDLDRINFYFRYKWENNWYYIDDYNVELSDNEILFVSVALSNEMPLLNQGSSWNLQMFITTASGFVYRLNDMRIKRTDSNVSPSESNKRVYITYELT